VIIENTETGNGLRGYRRSSAGGSRCRTAGPNCAPSGPACPRRHRRPAAHRRQHRCALRAEGGREPARRGDPP
jgi:hypothetical protein